MADEISNPAPLASLLGRAAVGAFGIAGIEILFAAVAPPALATALSDGEWARYLAVAFLGAALPAIPAGLLAWALHRARPKLAPLIALLLPALYASGEGARRAVATGESRPIWFALAALLLALALLLLALLRSVTLPRRLTFGGLAGALLLWPLLAAWSFAPGGREPPDLEAATPASDAEGDPAPRPPVKNLLVLLVDTLRADHLGCYGYSRATSPRLDAFAHQSTLFEQAATPKPKTSPAVASLFTGTLPQTHRVHAARCELGEENVTLAETLRDAGFTTFGLSANANINGALGFDQGFDELRWVTRADLGGGKHRNNDARTLATLAIRWLSEHRGERFFLYAHLLDPHAPYRCAEPFASMFDGDALDGRLGTLEATEPSDDYFGGIEKSVFLPEVGFDLDRYVSRYDGEIRYTDEAIGAVLDALDKLGLADDTVVVFLSDHGETMVERAAWFNHGLFPYEEQVRVPLVVRGPGIAVDRRRSEQVSLAALMPTLLDLVGVETPETVETRSFASLLREESPPSAGAPMLLSAREEELTMTWGVRTKRWKYLHNPAGLSAARAFRLLDLLRADRRFAVTLGGGEDWELEEELYDLAADPGERENVAGREPRVREALRRWMEERRNASRPVAKAPRVFTADQFSTEARRELMHLGYLGK